MPATSKRSRKVAFEDEVDTPTPSDFTGDGQSPEPSQKRARKPWGQPVEPFEKIIGPRKRAKTEQEKDQRAKERILRNRKAADASRQRRKDEQDRLQRRIAELEADLEVYQNKFGPLPKHESSISDNYTVNDIPQYQPHISPQLLSQPNQPEPIQGTSFELTPPDSTDGDIAFDAFQQQSLIKQEQTFTNTLPIDNQPSNNVQEASYSAESVMTQYPAAILCDPQCQTLSTRVAPSSTFPTTFISLLQLLLISTISTKSCLLTRLRTLIRSTSSLMDCSSTTTSLKQQMDTFKILTILSSAILLRWISTSSSTTTKPMFRIKLLSRLLSRSPCMARSLETCARKGLQRVVDSGLVGADASATREWASLLTVQWAIRRHVQLSSRERSRHRDCSRIGHGDDAVGQGDGRLGTQNQDGGRVSTGTQVAVLG